MKCTTCISTFVRSGLIVFRSESIPQKGLHLGTDLDLPYCTLASNTSMSKSFLLHLHLHGNDLPLLRRVRNCLTLVHSCTTCRCIVNTLHTDRHSTNCMHKETSCYFFRSAILIWWALYCKHLVPKSSKLCSKKNSANVCLIIIANGCTMSS